MQSSALIKSTLAEVNELNAEALKRGIDIEPLLAVIQKAGILAKKDSDKEAIQETMMQLPFENNYTII